VSRAHWVVVVAGPAWPPIAFDAAPITKMKY
jgi:hypothetical protein